MADKLSEGETLKSCPFCGSVPQESHPPWPSISFPEGVLPRIACGNFQCPMSMKYIEREVWNTRTDSAVAEVEAVWDAAIAVVQQSAKKSEKSGLKIAAVEIAIRRLESAKAKAIAATQAAQKGKRMREKFYAALSDNGELLPTTVRSKWVKSKLKLS